MCKFTSSCALNDTRTHTLGLVSFGIFFASHSVQGSSNRIFDTHGAHVCCSSNKSSPPPPPRSPFLATSSCLPFALLITRPQSRSRPFRHSTSFARANTHIHNSLSFISHTSTRTSAHPLAHQHTHARTHTNTRNMPAPAVVGLAVAAAANTDSGRRAIKQLEELPLLAARSASDAALRHGSRLPEVAHYWYSALTPAQLTGAMLVAAAAFTFSLLSVLVKITAHSISAMEVVFWRASVAWILNLVRRRFYARVCALSASNFSLPCLSEPCLYLLNAPLASLAMLVHLPDRDEHRRSRTRHRAGPLAAAHV